MDNPSLMPHSGPMVIIGFLLVAAAVVAGGYFWFARTPEIPAEPSPKTLGLLSPYASLVSLGRLPRGSAETEMSRDPAMSEALYVWRGLSDEEVGRMGRKATALYASRQFTQRRDQIMESVGAAELS